MSKTNSEMESKCKKYDQQISQLNLDHENNLTDMQLTSEKKLSISRKMISDLEHKLLNDQEICQKLQDTITEDKKQILEQKTFFEQQIDQLCSHLEQSKVSEEKLQADVTNLIA